MINVRKEAEEEVNVKEKVYDKLFWSVSKPAKRGGYGFEVHLHATQCDAQKGLVTTHSLHLNTGRL